MVIESSKRTARYTYKKHRGYTPMVGHIAETDQVVVVEFREGNESLNKENLQFIQTNSSLSSRSRPSGGASGTVPKPKSASQGLRCSPPKSLHTTSSRIEIRTRSVKSENLSPLSCSIRTQVGLHRRSQAQGALIPRVQTTTHHRKPGNIPFIHSYPQRAHRRSPSEALRASSNPQFHSKSPTSN